MDFVWDLVKVLVLIWALLFLYNLMMDFLRQKYSNKKSKLSKSEDNSKWSEDGVHSNSDYIQKYRTPKHQKKLAKIYEDAIKYKKTDLKTAIQKLEAYIQYAKTHKQWIDDDYALELPKLIACLGNFDEAYQKIEEIYFSVGLLEPLKPDSKFWYMREEKFCCCRCSILATENKKEAWVQYVNDSQLEFYNHIMWKIRERDFWSLQNKKSKNGEYSSSVLREQQHIEDVLNRPKKFILDSLGQKGLIALGLQRHSDELFELFKQIKVGLKDTNIDIEPLQRWFSELIKKEAL